MTRMEVAVEGDTARASGAVPEEAMVGSKGSEKPPPVAVAGNRRPCRPFERDRGTI